MAKLGRCHRLIYSHFVFARQFRGASSALGVADTDEVALDMQVLYSNQCQDERAHGRDLCLSNHFSMVW